MLSLRGIIAQQDFREGMDVTIVNHDAKKTAMCKSSITPHLQPFILRNPLKWNLKFSI
jgi:hypothetical protein